MSNESNEKVSFTPKDVYEAVKKFSESTAYQSFRSKALYDLYFETADGECKQRRTK